MESLQQTLRSYQALTLRNKNSLEALSQHIHRQKSLVGSTASTQFQQLKRQYDAALVASKASIDRNIQLQAELQYKQQHLRALKQKLYENFQQIEGLEFEMKRAAVKINNQRKNRQEQRVKQSSQKLRKQIDRLNKKKYQLEQQDNEMKTKQKIKRENVQKLEQQIQQTQRRYSQQQKAQLIRIQKLEHQISWYKQNIRSQRQQSDKSSTPQKANRSIHLQQMILKIQQYRNTLQS